MCHTCSMHDIYTFIMLDFAQQAQSIHTVIAVQSAQLQNHNRLLLQRMKYTMKHQYDSNIASLFSYFNFNDNSQITESPASGNISHPYSNLSSWEI